jgi:hypothetical protein
MLLINIEWNKDFSIKKKVYLIDEIKQKQIQWNTLEYIGIHWNTLWYIGLYYDTLEYIEKHLKKLNTKHIYVNTNSNPKI